MTIEPLITARTSEHLCSENIGLGNVLFQIASIYGISKKYNIESCFNTVIDYCNILKTRFGIDLTTNILRHFQVAKEVNKPMGYTFGFAGNSYDFDKGLIQQALEHPNIHFIVHAYLENIDYFNEFYEEIKYIFSPTELSRQKVHNLLPELFDTKFTPVSIHFRYLWNQLEYDYYAKAVKYIKERVPNPHFFIFCDSGFAFNLESIGVCDGEYTQVKFAPEDIYVEFYAIGQCSHHIVSQSTFCFWGIYLNRNDSKIVIKSEKMAMKWYGDRCVSL